MKTSDMVHLFKNQGLSLRKIGKEAGVSATWVFKCLRSAGIDTSDAAKRVSVTCAQCGAGFTLPRSRWRTTLRHYCSAGCYMAHVRNPSYRMWRQGQRIARKTVSERFPIKDGMVVHHHDGDCRNNTLTNLAVFACQSDHMSYHRGGPAKPIWDGRAK